MRHFTPPTPWRALDDAEWAVLAPFFPAEAGPGRPCPDRRARLDAILANTLAGDPWRALPNSLGRPDTIARQFRRWAHAGAFTRLLEAVANPAAPPALRAMEYWLCRLARRAMRMLKMTGLTLALRLGLLTALPMVPWLMPNPTLSQALMALSRERIIPGRPMPPHQWIGALAKCVGIAGGRAVWSRRFAPP